MHTATRILTDGLNASSLPWAAIHGVLRRRRALAAGAMLAERR